MTETDWAKIMGKRSMTVESYLLDHYHRHNSNPVVTFIYQFDSSPQRIDVKGCTDLRAFALRCRDFEHLEKLGLKHLTESVLGKTLDKSSHVRLSDWEAEELSEQQKKYAANDALVATDIFR